MAKCLTCQKEKTEHQSPLGLLQPLKVPEQKWEMITIDFVTRLPMTVTKKDVIWVIVDHLTKSVHFLAIRTNYAMQRLTEIYITKILRPHGVPVSITSNQDPLFTLRFWKRLQEALGSKLQFSIDYNPQIDGQSESVRQVLEGML